MRLDGSVMVALLVSLFSILWMTEGLSIGRGIADITGLASEGALVSYG